MDPKEDKHMWGGGGIPGYFEEMSLNIEFKNWEFPCLLYLYGYKKDILFWKFPKVKMSKNFGNLTFSLGGSH